MLLLSLTRISSLEMLFENRHIACCCMFSRNRVSNWLIIFRHCILQARIQTAVQFLQRNENVLKSLQWL